MRLCIYNARIVDAVTDSPGSVIVEDGKIRFILMGKDSGSLERMLSLNRDNDYLCIDAKGLTLMPSFIDMHAHFRDPGQLWKEDIHSGLMAAAAGGFGALVLMPNTVPVTSDEEQAADVRRRAADWGMADVFQTVSLTRGFDGADTSHLENLNPREIPVASEDGRDVASAATLLEAMGKCTRNGVIVSCHSEDPTLAAQAKTYREKALALLRAAPGADTQKNIRELHENLRKAEELLCFAEDIATERNLLMAAGAGCRVHIAHVSTEGALDAVRRAKAARPASMVSCEVTPHHLALTDSICQFVNPPLRPEKDRQALIAGILDGTVDVIATDHAPHSAEDKANGAPGFSGLETAFAVCNSILVQTGRIPLSTLSRLMSARPASLLGLNKGLLKPGADADMVLVNPDLQWSVKPATFCSKGKNTPFAGEKLSGKVMMTIYKGKTVFGAVQ